MKSDHSQSKDASSSIRAGVIASEAIELLTFNPDDGRIWLNDKRMAMFDVQSFGGMRTSLIKALGVSEARTVLTRIGYDAGVRDAQLVRSRWPRDFARHASIGPIFRGLSGILKAEPIRLESNSSTGSFRAEYVWKHCIEDDAHIEAFGVGAEPACWMEVGYASGFVSTMSGRNIVFREISCRSTGSDTCHVIAKPAEEWDGPNDVTEITPILRARDSTARSSSRSVASTFEAIVGDSTALTASLQLLRSVAPTSASVLIWGESGVGKELFAQTLHRTSLRKDGPFVAVNCAAIPDTLIESDLFGVERGAFTGASVSRPGRFERANGGTIFLDEIGTLNLVSQAKLLRVLQENEVERVGGTRTTSIDVRVVAATNADLRAAVERGEFREDLYFRLNVFPIKLPPLRERRDDIRALASHFLDLFNEKHGKRVAGFTPRATQSLLNYHFPGNIRELQNLVERAVILAGESPIDMPHLFTQSEDILLNRQLLGVEKNGHLGFVSHQHSDAIPNRPPENASNSGQDIVRALYPELTEDSLHPSLPELEQRLRAKLIARALEESHGNVAAAARQLGLTRHQLDYHIKMAK